MKEGAGTIAQHSQRMPHEMGSMAGAAVRMYI